MITTNSPCSRCVRKGIPPNEANRVSRPNHSYCRECDNEYQRERNKKVRRVRTLERFDLDSLGNAITNLRTVIDVGKDFLDLQEALLAVEVTFAGIYALAEKRVNKPKEPKKVKSVTVSREVLLRDLNLALKFRHQNPKDIEPQIRFLRAELKDHYDYNGPEMVDSI